MSAVKKKNGFSLIELVVAVVILGVLAVGTTISISIVYKANVKRAASTLCVMLSEARQEAISAKENEIALEIRINGDEEIEAIIKRGGTELTKKSIANSRVDLYVKKVGDSDKYHLVKNLSGVPGAKEETVITLHFKKETGGFSESYSDLILKGADTMNIILISQTGRCYVE